MQSEPMILFIAGPPVLWLMNGGDLPPAVLFKHRIADEDDSNGGGIMN
jgi:hypothetical protein